MAIDADGETSDPEPDSEVTDTSPTREQLVLEVDELNKTKTALNEAKTGPILLRPCESCSALKKGLDDAHARINLLEKSCSSSSQNALVECDVCPALLQELDDFKYA